MNLQKMHFLHEIDIFRCHVTLQEGNSAPTLQKKSLGENFQKSNTLQNVHPVQDARLVVAAPSGGEWQMYR